ncbi:MAG: PEP-CTERM sorting domain-containing protein [Verrucomicrobiota bacterium]
MKINMNLKIAVLAITIMATFAVLPESARADVYWNGSASSDWSNPANWINGLPSVGGAGSAVINPWGSFPTPTVSSLGNTTVGQTYLAAGGGLDVVGGGQLSTVDLITGVWGNSGSLNISGGTLNISGLLNMGAAGFDGDVIISGGTLTAGSLSINTAGGAGMDLSGSGSFITASSQLGNVNYWIANNAITANGGLGTVYVDSISQPGSIVLTVQATPEPSTMALAIAGGAAVLFLRRHRK